MMYKKQAQFDPSLSYLATCAMTISGQRLLPGNLIPDTTPIRLKRQLYDARRIKPVEATSVSAPVEATPVNMKTKKVGK